MLEIQRQLVCKKWLQFVAILVGAEYLNHCKRYIIYLPKDRYFETANQLSVRPAVIAAVFDLFSHVNGNIRKTASEDFFLLGVSDYKIGVNIVRYSLLNLGLDCSLGIQSVRIFHFIFHDATFFKTFEA